MSQSPNRLARESSPYLLLHATNPVDWYPWGEEAFRRARREDKPIFLSIGYSTCYWCHVMERESFSDPEIADQMNAGFVCIKLDREERPELDEIYMAATQLLTRAGGWPNSLFLTPERKPFFAGTYFPPRDSHGRPGFRRVLASLREAWALRRAEVVAQAEAVAEGMREHLSAGRDAAEPPDPGLSDATASALAARFDPTWGGFGRAPKFPSPSNLFFLLDRAQAGRAEERQLLVVTLDRMARGGIHDQLAGGFHRYSTDAQWLVPHFEKMLYDNASLARLYAAADPLDPGAGFSRVARRTLDFVLAELQGGDGGFLSAIDAETDGQEGAYYTWTRQELRDGLGPELDALLAPIYGFDGEPNFEADRYVLHLPERLENEARARGLEVNALVARIEPGRLALLARRQRRKRPLVDDKVLADWNGLMIAAMAEGGQRLSEPRYLAAAARAADFILSRLVVPGSGERLHAWREGRAHIPALLDDYAFLIEGLLALHSATGEARWLSEAARLQAEQDRRLADPAGGYFAAGEAPDLLLRAKSGADGAVAAGNGVSAQNLLELFRLTGESAYRERARATLATFGHELNQMPIAHVTLVRAAARLGAAGEERGPGFVAGAASVVALEADSLEEEAREVVLASARLHAGENEVRSFHVDLEIRPGWHLNANPAGHDALLPTRLSAVLGRVRAVRYPPGEGSPGDVRTYRGQVRIEGEIELPPSGAPALELSYQACDEARCLPPVTRLLRFA